jgi:photosystem II stability/assembly factor-like uncharacterized protein
LIVKQATFVATTGSGVGVVEQKTSGEWTVEYSLEDRDVRCLSADPFDPNTVYVGTQGNGVWRSVDRGKSWQPAGLQGVVVKSLAVSPHDRGVILAGAKPATVFRTEDGGRSWGELKGFKRIPFRWWWFTPAETPNQAYVQAIAISPEDPDVVMAGIEFGAVVRSQDGGQTWSGHKAGSLRDCHQLLFHRSDGKWAYEAGGSGGGASFSHDGGRTWRKAGGGLEKHYGVACAADPAEPDVWYIAVGPGPGKAYGEEAEAYLYRREGEGWQAIGWENHPMRHMPLSLVTDPGEPGGLYAGVRRGDVWHSPDRGETWEKMPFRFRGIWRWMLLLE